MAELNIWERLLLDASEQQLTRTMEQVEADKERGANPVPNFKKNLEYRGQILDIAKQFNVDLGHLSWNA